MTALDALLLMGDTHTVACVVTDCREPPGTNIIYANPAFHRLTGFTTEELQEKGFPILHGPKTEQTVLRRFHHAVRHAQAIRGVITNYRKDGVAYLCEIALRPLLGRDGIATHFIAFEREVRRRRGRPNAQLIRFRPVETEQSAYDSLFMI